MQKSQNKAVPKDSFGVNDVLYILFKHKWKILVLSTLGLMGGAYVYSKRIPYYQSSSKVLVKYVPTRSGGDSSDGDLSTMGPTGTSVITTEVEIIKSEDLAIKVADAIGAKRILPEAGDQATALDAAQAILGKLEVGAMPGNNVIGIAFSSPDPDLALDVSRELLTKYAARHLEIHRSRANFDMVSKQVDDAHGRLRKTEEELNKLRSDSKMTNWADASSALAAQRAKTMEEIMAARADLADQTALLAAMEKTMGPLPDADTAEKDAPRAKQVIPGRAITEYKATQDALALLNKRAVDLNIKYTNSPLIAANQRQIAQYEAKGRALLAKYPELTMEAAALDSGTGMKTPQAEMLAIKAKIASITARIELYNQLLEDISNQFKEQYAIGARIDELERQRQLEDTEYRSLQTKLKAAQLDLDLNPNDMPNMTVVQHPSKPIPVPDKMNLKVAAGLAGGGIGLGLGIAFLIELLFNRKVQRPMEIQARLQLPLLMSIPYIKRRERGGLLLSGDGNGAPRIGAGDPDESADLGLSTTAATNGALQETGGRRANHFILPYSETIRDRIIFNFEVNNVIHKPKLVAVTGLSEGAGASTIAAGLAKSFSEIKGAKVLLVDLSSAHPEDSPVFGEIARHSLSGALQLAKNNKFKQSNQRLYYASATARRDDSGLTTFSPMHLYELMPHLQASEFDYIIFDMPPIDQTSRTLTMAGLMDKVLLILDAENTSRDALKWGYSELVKGRADVSCIFNKTRSHAPGWLLGEA